MKHIYILDENDNPKSCDSVLEWANWFETSQEQRIVGADRLDGENESVYVSTVFLGLDHRTTFDIPTPPLLWETMVFRVVPTNKDEEHSGDEIESMRHESKKDAALWHTATVRRWRARLGLAVLVVLALAACGDDLAPPSPDAAGDPTCESLGCDESGPLLCDRFDRCVCDGVACVRSEP